MQESPITTAITNEDFHNPRVANFNGHRRERSRNRRQKEAVKEVQGQKLPMKTFYFPLHKIRVEATSLREATKKLNSIINKNK